MAKYAKKPEIVEATQWFKNGDHPLDGNERLPPDDPSFPNELYEGKIVRYFRRPDVDGTTKCLYCARLINDHGWIENGGRGFKVCPGDFIVTRENGTHYPVHAVLFDETYELVKETSRKKSIAGLEGFESEYSWNLIVNDKQKAFSKDEDLMEEINKIIRSLDAGEDQHIVIECVIGEDNSKPERGQ